MKTKEKRKMIHEPVELQHQMLWTLQSINDTLLTLAHYLTYGNTPKAEDRE